MISAIYMKAACKRTIPLKNSSLFNIYIFRKEIYAFIGYIQFHWEFI